MRNDPVIFRMKALALRTFVDNGMDGKFIFDGCPSRRELGIQIAKLERMLDAFLKKFTPDAESVKTATERKAFRKKIGPEIAKLNQQTKKMQGLFFKMMEECVFSMPQPPGYTRGQFRSAMVESSKLLEKAIYDGMQKFQNELSEAMPQKHLKP